MFGDSAQNTQQDTGFGAPSAPPVQHADVGGDTAVAPAMPVVATLPLDGTAPALSSDTKPYGAPAHDPAAAAPAASPARDELLGIKSQALQQLTPLIDHLEQSPEERFRTTMMMIQAADDQTLLKMAYESAQKITDEKVRAQALLDIVNEINYFTQNH